MILQYRQTCILLELLLYSRSTKIYTKNNSLHIMKYYIKFVEIGNKISC